MSARDGRSILQEGFHQKLIIRELLRGMSGSKRSAFSLATLVIMIRKALEGARPIAANTGVASYLIPSLILALTTALAAFL